MSPAVLSWDLTLLIGWQPGEVAEVAFLGIVLPCQGKTPAVLGDAAEMLVRTGEGCATLQSWSLEDYRVNILRTSSQMSLSCFRVPGFPHQGPDLHTTDLPWLRIKKSQDLWDLNNQVFSLLLNCAWPLSRRWTSLSAIT